MGDVGYALTTIAIDDIHIQKGECHPNSILLFKCDSTQSIPESKVCDGVIDCKNGLDEADCGSCSFKDKSKCGFTQRTTNKNINTSYQWRNSNFTVGPKSAPFNTPNFKVAASYRRHYYTETADLYSPKIKGSAAGLLINLVIYLKKFTFRPII